MFIITFSFSFYISILPIISVRNKKTFDSLWYIFFTNITAKSFSFFLNII